MGGRRGGRGPGRGQPGAGAFADQVAFELGQGGEDVEDELAAGVVVSIASWRLRKPMPRSARPVTGWTGAAGATQPIKLPHHEGVAGPQLVQELLENRAVGAGAAGGLGEPAERPSAGEWRLSQKPWWS
jgi:hypothetical protein